MNKQPTDSIIETMTNGSLDEELTELIKQSSEKMPTLVEQIRDCQQYCSNIKAFITEISVTEDWTNG